jgi:hypothetical protein
MTSRTTQLGSNKTYQQTEHDFRNITKLVSLFLDIYKICYDFLKFSTKFKLKKTFLILCKK